MSSSAVEWFVALVWHMSCSSKLQHGNKLPLDRHHCWCVQVSCNDWHLESELSSAYLLEKLVYSMQEAGVEPGPPKDEADTWVATPYAMLQPCFIQGPDDPRVQGTWQRPWADEMEVCQIFH